MHDSQDPRELDRKSAFEDHRRLLSVICLRTPSIQTSTQKKQFSFDSKRVGENHGVKLVVFASNLVAILYRFIHHDASIQCQPARKTRCLTYLLSDTVSKAAALFFGSPIQAL